MYTYFAADDAPGTRAIVDDYRFTKRRAHRLGQDAGGDIGAPAGRERHDEADWSFRIAIRGGRWDREQDAQSCEQ